MFPTQLDDVLDVILARWLAERQEAWRVKAWPTMVSILHAYPRSSTY
jgi:hypothetical protein